MEEVTIGDKIYGDDGKLTTVVDKIDVGVVPMYEFTLSDGRKVESSADHIWRVYDHKLDVEREVRTEEIATKEFIEDENKKERKITRYSLPTTEPVNYPEIKVDVDFYQIGLSIKEDFGAIKATELKFDANMRLTVIKGEVGSGKTTLNKAMRLTTQGSDTLVDKNLYDGNINMVAQLLDGDKKVFVGCKSEEGKPLTYFLYEEDENAQKAEDYVDD